jgi:outer membrane protein OmpA-like peptidoglycan-associated protein/Tol biopolymer transport system component
MFLKHKISLLCFLITVCGFSQESVKAKINRKIEITYNLKKVTSINSEGAEFSPALNGSKLIFVSDRYFDLLNVGENRWKKNKYVNLYSSDITIPAQDSVIFSKPVLLQEHFHSLNHIGPVCYSSDGNEAFLSQDEKEYGHVNKPHLYQVKAENGKWKEKKIMPFVKEDYIFSHPSLSDDGQTLYFVSDMPGGAGGKDIFYVTRSGEGWTEPVALGPEVNTSSDEMFPYFRNNVLYFSSNRQGGAGGLDLFKSEITSAGKWKNAVSLGNSINSPKDDFGFILDKEMRSGFFSSNREGGNGDDDIYYFKVIETVTMESQDIEGKFAYKSLKGGIPEGMEVMLYNEQGEFIGKATTDKDGYFRFENLPLNKDFVIRTAENGNTLTLTILDAEGEPSAFLLSDKSGAFIYKKLSLDYTGSLALMEVEDTEFGKSGKISGQFVYEKLSTGDAFGLNVYLVDEAGNIVHKTLTDKNGNFEFRNLPVGSNYILKTDKNNDEMILFVFNKEGEVTAQLRMNENGEFTYRKLNPNYAQITMMESSDTEMLAPKSRNIEGNFVYKNLKGSPSEMNFEILNDKNEIIYKGKTDKNGGIFVTSLPLSEQYLFRIPADDPNFAKDMELILTSRTNVKIATLIKDENGNFIFKPLEMGATTIAQVENTDTEFTTNGWVIYFDLNSSVLSDESKNTLKTLAEQMKKDKLIKLVVNGHTDSRADENYNDWLSERRSNSVKKYMNKQGISESRIKISFYGEKQLKNKCADGAECSDEEHKINRRVELNFLK